MYRATWAEKAQSAYAACVTSFLRKDLSFSLEVPAKSWAWDHEKVIMYWVMFC